MKDKSFIVWAVLFLCACPLLATIHFNDGQIHNIDYEVSDYIWVDHETPQMYTTINCLDGALIDRLYGCENSKINILGGEIIGEFIICGSSEGNISGGLIEKFLDVFDFGHVNIFGGTINIVFSRGFSKVNISGGEILSLASNGSSQVNISAGLINKDFWSFGSSNVNITGGLFEGNFGLVDQGMIKIFGYDFAVDGQPVGYGELTSILGGSPWDESYRHLTGTLLSGEFIDTDFRIGHDAKLILTIPEPATILLLGLGGLILRKRRNR